MTPVARFAMLRPDRVARRDQLVQHIAVQSAAEDGHVRTWCGLALAVGDLDPSPRAGQVASGAPCMTCVRAAPAEVTATLHRISGDLADAVPLASADPVAEGHVYAACMAGLMLRHIVPEQAPRWPYERRHVLVVECGHMAYCPEIGPAPSRDWPVCCECLHVVRRRTPVHDVDGPVARDALP